MARNAAINRAVSTGYLPHYLGVLRMLNRPGFQPEMMIEIAARIESSPSVP
jgi:hypothetical protein